MMRNKGRLTASLLAWRAVGGDIPAGGCRLRGDRGSELLLGYSLLSASLMESETAFTASTFFIPVRLATAPANSCFVISDHPLFVFRQLENAMTTS